MAVITFKRMVDEMQSDLKKVYAEQLPFASVVALTRTAVVVRDLIKEDIKRVFDRPTPYAVNAPRAVPATKSSMSSAVLLRDFGGTPAGAYLGPEIDPGSRGLKRSERALQLAGAMTSGQFEMPSRQATLDAYGNLPRSQIVQMLSAVKAFGEQGYTANVTKRSSARKKGFKTSQTGTPYFMARSKQNGAPLGIWQVVAPGKVKPVLIFANRTPEYHTRLPFDDLVRKHADANFGRLLEQALRQFGG